jgi:hypothetical protein
MWMSGPRSQRKTALSIYWGSCGSDCATSTMQRSVARLSSSFSFDSAVHSLDTTSCGSAAACCSHAPIAARSPSLTWRRRASSHVNSPTVDRPIQRGSNDDKSEWYTDGPTDSADRAGKQGVVPAGLAAVVRRKAPESSS